MSESEKPARSFWSLFSDAEEPKEPAAEAQPSALEKLFLDEAPEPKEPPLCAREFDSQSVFWAMRNLPLDQATKHFFVCGATGSGKTITIKLFLQSIAPRFETGPGNPDYFALCPEDLADLPALANRLKQPQTTFDTWLAGRLSDETKKTLADYHGVLSDQALLQAGLLEDLNQILAGPSIHDEARYKAITLRPATQALLSKPPTGSAPRLNRFLLEDACPRELRQRQPEQLIVFDAKCEIVPELAALDLRPEDDNVYILNPFDERAAVWNVAEAVQTPGMARSFAALLVPEERNTTAPYFSDAARELVYAVILALNRVATTTWTLRDLLCALDSRERIEAVTANDDRARALANRILSDENHSLGVLSTLATKIGPFEQVAALWHTHRNNKPFTIPEFLARPGVLILGNDPVLRQSLWPINAILLKALANEILRNPDARQPKHWFVLDEFRAMERVDCIHDLINLGRSKGVSVLIGLQSYEGLASVYEDLGANDILSQCAHKTFLRVGGPRTAEWAQEFFGSVRHTESSMTQTKGAGGGSTAISYTLQDRSMFLASYFLDLPLTGVGRPYVAVCDVPYLGETLIVQRSFDEVLSWCRPLCQDVPSIVPRPNPADQFLVPWTDKEQERFCKKDSDAARRNKKSRRKAKLPSRHRLSH